MCVSVSRAIIVNDDGEIVLVKRAGSHNYNPNKWEIPGGKLDKGECYLTAVLREVREELRINIFVDTSRTHLIYRIMQDGAMQGHRYVGMTYLAKMPANAELKLSGEHRDRPVWCTPQEALNYDLTRESRLAITTLFP